MQYLSSWGPRSPPSKKPARSENDASPARRRTPLKSQPSMPILSGAQKSERRMWMATSERGPKPGSLLETQESGHIFGSPESPKDVTSASIHPSEASYSAGPDPDAPLEGESQPDSDQHSLPSPESQEETQPEADEGNLSGITEVAQPQEVERQSSPLASPMYGGRQSIDPSESKRSEGKLKGISESLHLDSQFLSRSRSSIAASTNASKRFSTGGIGIHFANRDRRSIDFDTPASRLSRYESRDLSTPHTPEPSLDWVRLEKNLDRIQSLLEQNSAQIRSLEHVQAANWERAVSLLMQNAEQIGELARGQQRLGSMYEDLSKMVMESSRSPLRTCEHDVRTPPKKLGRRIVGYVYDDKTTERSGRGR